MSTDCSCVETCKITAAEFAKDITLSLIKHADITDTNKINQTFNIFFKNILDQINS